MTRILHIDSSVRGGASVTRALSARTVHRLTRGAANAEVVRRDLADPLPLIGGAWVGANFTPQGDRTDDQHQALALSEELIAEVEAADTLVIGLPVYNFGVPAGFKAWVDQVVRAGRTFRYTESGPEGLLTGKRAIVAVASGGTRLGSDADFATGYARFILGFVGITDVTFIAADQMAVDPDTSRANAEAAVDELAIAA